MANHRTDDILKRRAPPPLWCTRSIDNKSSRLRDHRQSKIRAQRIPRSPVPGLSFDEYCRQLDDAEQE